MREHKYRAWDKKKKEMWIPSYITDEGIACCCTHEQPDELPDDPLMQYTGLKDKNGKEIYEGDIMSDPLDKHPAGFIKYMPHGAWVIKRFIGTTWHDISVHGGEKPKDTWISYYEVIGNIWEHSHLLKEGK